MFIFFFKRSIIKKQFTYTPGHLISTVICVSITNWSSSEARMNYLINKHFNFYTKLCFTSKVEIDLQFKFQRAFTVHLPNKCLFHFCLLDLFPCSINVLTSFFFNILFICFSNLLYDQSHKMWCHRIFETLILFPVMYWL